MQELSAEKSTIETRNGTHYWHWGYKKAEDELYDPPGWSIEKVLKDTVPYIKKFYSESPGKKWGESQEVDAIRIVEIAQEMNKLSKELANLKP